MSYLPSYAYCILASFLASLTIYGYGKAPSYLKTFPPFLLLTFSIEGYGSYLGSYGKNNLLIYNLFSVFEFCYYLFIIRMMIKSRKVRRVILYSIFLYLPAALVNIFRYQGLTTFHTITYSIGCVLVVLFCIIYFIEMFREPRSVKLLALPSFWICTSLIFYFSCSFPLFAFSNFLLEWSPLILNNFTSIVSILNIFLYTLFTIAFLCRIRIRKYTSL